MLIDTQKLIVDLLNQELRKSDHLATRLYHKEVQDAKEDFIKHSKTLGYKNESR